MGPQEGCAPPSCEELSLSTVRASLGSQSLRSVVTHMAEEAATWVHGDCERSLSAAQQNVVMAVGSE